MDYEKHIEALAREVGATVKATNQHDGSPAADVNTRTLYLPYNDGSEHWYWAALHELGHIVDKPEPKDLLEMLVTTPRIVEHEALAWEWAIANSLLPFNDTARADVAWTLGTYIDDMLHTYGVRGVDALRDGAAGRLAAQLGPDVDTSSALAWAQAFGYRGPDVGTDAWRSFAALAA